MKVGIGKKAHGLNAEFRHIYGSDEHSEGQHYAAFYVIFADKRGVQRYYDEMRERKIYSREPLPIMRDEKQQPVEERFRRKYAHDLCTEAQKPPFVERKTAQHKDYRKRYGD